MVADIVWSYLGDVKQYIEPFFGSGAVLLKRPPTKLEKIYEIANDKDGHIANVWRSIQFSPDEVARWCDWPVNHADLVARKKVLNENEGYLLNGLQNDPEWHDAKLAGYWVWAASCWIGSGLNCPNQRPHLAGDMGITSQRPHMDSRRKILEPSTNVYEWINALSRRLRYVKVVCGDWSRVCGGNWQDNNKPVGMFFDPPYATSGRDETIYRHDSMTVAKDVEVWCLERGKNPNYRIVVAGYDDEYQSLLDNGWIFQAWSAAGGYSNAKSRGEVNRHRERLFISPHCLKKTKDKELFS
jgi:site-specific DNA-adenine methylase